MRAAVLFSGIGGWEIACERNGVDVVWAAEWDAWKRGRYQERWPLTPLYGDVEKLDGRQMLRDHGPVDILLGSPPCQDVSAANSAGRGLDGDSSRYYLEAIRLARETGARWIGFENSPRLRTRGADRVLSLLEESGYAVWANVVEAEDAGAPHERGRSFVLGCRRDAIEGPDAERAGLWLQQGWRGWTGRAGAAELAGHVGNAAGQRPVQAPEFGSEKWNEQAYDGSGRQAHADADGNGQSDRAEHAEVGGSAGTDGAADASGGEAADAHEKQRRHRAGSNAGQKLTPLERAALCPWDQRGDGLAGYLRVVDELRDRLSSQGLSERKIKSEFAKMRSALGDAVVIPVVWAVVRAIVRTDVALRPSGLEVMVQADSYAGHSPERSP